MHIAAFIGELHLKPSYLSTFKRAISPILSDTQFAIMYVFRFTVVHKSSIIASVYSLVVYLHFYT